MTGKKSAKDYKFIRLLGEGSFSSVYLAVDANVRNTPTKSPDSSQNESGIELESDSSETNQGPIIKSKRKLQKYAIKVCQKSHIWREGKKAAIMREKEIMNQLNKNPNEHFIRLYYAFQDLERLFFVMTYAENGDLLTYMQKYPLSLELARNYTCQLIDALEHLHKMGIVHRDLKPENILLDAQMNIMISDFGSAQIYTDDDEDLEHNHGRRNSFVGTAQYVSPEMLEKRQATNKSDLWAFGVIIYQMITNVMPFNAPNEYLIFQKIQKLDYEFPENFDDSAQNLISSLIKLDPLERLGASDDIKNVGYESIKNHNFLKGQAEDAMIPKCLRNSNEEDHVDLDHIQPGLDEVQLLRILTIG